MLSGWVAVIRLSPRNLAHAHLSLSWQRSSPCWWTIMQYVCVCLSLTSLPSLTAKIKRRVSRGLCSVTFHCNNTTFFQHHVLATFRFISLYSFRKRSRCMILSCMCMSPVLTFETSDRFSRNLVLALSIYK